jgi:hypothetical protein
MATYKNYFSYLRSLGTKKKKKPETWTQTLEKKIRNTRRRERNIMKNQLKKKMNMIPYKGSVFDN